VVEEPLGRLLAAGPRSLAGGLAQKPIADRPDPPDVGGGPGPDAADAPLQVLDDAKLMEASKHPAADAAGRSFSGVVGEVQPLQLTGGQETEGRDAAQHGALALTQVPLQPPEPPPAHPPGPAFGDGI
jgi:hypothetical protein